MRVLMIAPPGAGKGTQGALIAAHFDIPHIATGELLRDHVARRTAPLRDEWQRRAAPRQGRREWPGRPVLCRPTQARAARPRGTAAALLASLPRGPRARAGRPGGRSDQQYRLVRREHRRPLARSRRGERQPR